MFKNLKHAPSLPRYKIKSLIVFVTKKITKDIQF